MNYIIIESQTTDSTAVIVNTFDNYSQAEQDYHTKLASAAVSEVPVHAVSMLNERGQLIKYECYNHAEYVEDET